MLLPDQASVEVFRSGEGTLEHPGMHDSASSAAGESAAPIRAYAINGDADLVFELSLAGGVLEKAALQYVDIDMERILIDPSSVAIRACLHSMVAMHGAMHALSVP